MCARRQLEALAASAAAEQQAHAATERSLLQRAKEAEAAARATSDAERASQVRAALPN
jgi:hypothetical protein